MGVVAATFLVLQFRRQAPSDLVFLGGVMLLTLLGIISPADALSGFANEALLTIAGLFAVTAALRRVGLLDWVGRKLLGSANTEGQALSRLAAALLCTSAFILNTALVAMLMPVVIDWCRRRQISPSRLLLPLSYLAILGGVCTLIGTSTTLVAQGKLREIRETQEAALKNGAQSPEPAGEAQTPEFQRQFVDALRPMTLFEIGWVGVPCALAGAAYLVLLGRRLLPDRRDIVEEVGGHRREYLVEMWVRPDCPLVGMSVEAAGLRNLPGLFLIEIDRDGEQVTPVAPQDVLRPNDHLVFAGVVSTIIDLERIPGLVPAADTNYESNPQRKQQRELTEVVLSRTSPLIGATVKEANFRQRYNAAVVAVHRNGVRLSNKIGNIRLEPGDTLLLQTRSQFVATYRNSRDFYLVSSVDGSNAIRHHKMGLAAALALGLVAWLIAAALLGGPRSGGWSSTAVAAISIAGLMIATRCVPITEARGAIDLHTLTTVAAALGLGKALTSTGAADLVARWMVATAGHNPYVLLLVVYLLAAVFTEMISNAAVAAMLLPLAAAVAWNTGVNPRPFLIAATLAASLSFATPVGYQSNLMVMGPGGYRPADYARTGVPLALVVMVVAMLLIPRLWPFEL